MEGNAVTTHLFCLLQAFVGTGFNLILNYDTATNFNPAHRQSDFEREPGKVSCNQSQVELATNLRVLQCPEKALLVHSIIVSRHEIGMMVRITIIIMGSSFKDLCPNQPSVMFILRIHVNSAFKKENALVGAFFKHCETSRKHYDSSSN